MMLFLDMIRTIVKHFYLILTRITHRSNNVFVFHNGKCNYVQLLIYDRTWPLFTDNSVQKASTLDKSLSFADQMGN